MDLLTDAVHVFGWNLLHLMSDVTSAMRRRLWRRPLAAARARLTGVGGAGTGCTSWAR